MEMEMVGDGESESIVKEKSSISNTCVRERESFGGAHKTVWTCGNLLFRHNVPDPSVITVFLLSNICLAFSICFSIFLFFFFLFFLFENHK